MTVALSGDGGDELFAGYERFAAGVAVDRVLRIRAIAGRAGRSAIGLAQTRPVLHRRPRRPGSAICAKGGAGDARFAYLEWISYVPDGWRRRLAGVAGRLGASGVRSRSWDATAGAKTLDRLLAVNMQTYLVDDLLVKMDRTSMAHSLEVRSPFLDTAAGRVRGAAAASSEGARALAQAGTQASSCGPAAARRSSAVPSAALACRWTVGSGAICSRYTDSMLGAGARLARPRAAGRRLMRCWPSTAPDMPTTVTRCGPC